MAELTVNRLTVEEFFGKMQNKKFIIPDFQRPYKWDKEKCETLWQDITNFMETEASKTAEYFLGAIVSNKYENGNLEIVDGQQRITTLMLILRAFYYKLEQMNENDKKANGLKIKVAPCLWDVDYITSEVEVPIQIHVESLVATEGDNDTLHTILEIGKVCPDAKDNYSINYTYFLDECNKYAERNPMAWYDLCVTFIDRCIVLPIECNNQETALTIFSTLNDRGLPLDDSDIFKAEIYKNTQASERDTFTKQWKELSETTSHAGMKIDDVFRYYTHIIRARTGQGGSIKEIGLRKFYAVNKYALLKDSAVMPEIMKLTNFWYYLSTGEESEANESYTISPESRKFIHCLWHYPNEYWKYIVSVYFMKNSEKYDFESGFCETLKKIVAYMFAKFLVYPSVNYVKPDVFDACVAIENEHDFWLGTAFDVSADNFYNSYKLSKALLLLHAYLNPLQESPIPSNFHIEHILPRRWQNTAYNSISYEDAKVWIESFGNRVVCEWKLNVQAGNSYFRQKKQRYMKSTIKNVLDLADYESDDFTVDEIKVRENNFLERILDFFDAYGVLTKPPTVEIKTVSLKPKIKIRSKF